jgi:beta-glucosidase
VDWGNGVYALRAVANGKHVTVTDDGVLVNDQVRPNGWVVRETFRLMPRGEDEVVIRHIASGKFVVVAADGLLAARGDELDDATRFILTYLSCGTEQAAEAARAADVAIVVVGNNPLINGRETEDRADLALPPAQERLLRTVAAANPATVLVVQSSYPYAIGWAQEHVPAILWSSHGGQEFGHALADVLFGDISPAGRLTQTWYTSAADLPELLDYDIIAADATYLYYRGTSLYPFGHGLSYTSFRYEDLACATNHDTLTVSVRVTNDGDRGGDEVVQLYTRQHASRVKQPLRALRGFRRIHLRPGESTVVEFAVPVTDLAFWDVTRGRRVVERARHSVLVGASSADIRLAASVDIEGEQIPPRAADHLAAIDHDDFADVLLRDATPVLGDAVESNWSGGAWIAFHAVALPGPRLGRARVRADYPASITLRLDDPRDGPVMARLEAPAGGRYDWADVEFASDAPAGVRDLYAVFEAAGVGLEWIEVGV